VAAAALVAAGLGSTPSAATRGATQRIGPGTTLERIQRSDPDGRMRAYVLRVDLAAPGVHAEVLFPGALSAVEPVSVMARRAGAIAGVNGDFFNIRASNAPVGPVVTGGRLIKGPQRHRTRVAGVGVDGIGRIASVRLQGSVTLPSGTRALVGLNDANPGFPGLIAPNGIGVFTPEWGSYTRAGAVRGRADAVEVTVRDDRVASVRRRAGAGAIAAGTSVLLGAGAGGRALAGLKAGDPVSVRYHQQSTAPAEFRFAIGGKYVLVRHGVVQAGLPTGQPAPRTAIGFSARGRRMLLVVTDGRQAAVPGLSIPELARFMRRLGAREALLLDDGGSTTIVGRLPGRRTLTVLNHPSDGRERPVANGIGVFATG
jgi:phosphodiester glycosidase